MSDEIVLRDGKGLGGTRRARGYRVGIGEYYVPVDENSSQFDASTQWVARTSFFEAVERVAPHVLAPIRTEYFACFRALLSLADRLDEHDALESFFERPSSLEEAARQRLVEAQWSATKTSVSLEDWVLIGVMDFVVSFADLCEQPELWELDLDWWANHEVAEVRQFADGRKALRESIHSWSRHHNLDESWVREMLYSTLSSWADGSCKGWSAPFDSLISGSIQADLETWPSPEVGGDHDQLAVDYQELLDGSHPFEFAPPWDDLRHDPAGNSSWNPRLEGREDARKRLLAAFSLHLEKELERSEGICRKLGWKKVRVKRNRSGSPFLHFEWLVRFQVEGWTHARIAKHYGLQTGEVPWEQPGTVGAAIRDVAELVGITLRRSRSGRPRKDAQQTSSPRSTINP